MCEYKSELSCPKVESLSNLTMSRFCRLRGLHYSSMYPSLLSPFLPLSEDPAQVLWMATKGIGKDSYRAREVNGIQGYDPSGSNLDK